MAFQFPKPANDLAPSLDGAAELVSRVGLVRLGLRAFAFNAELFARALLGWTPDATQASVLRAGERRVVLNCSRQWGKTTVAATKVLHFALGRRECVCLIVAENLGQTAEVFLKIDRYLDILGVPARRESGKAVARVLPNGARVIGIAAREAGVRGYTAD